MMLPIEVARIVELERRLATERRASLLRAIREAGSRHPTLPRPVPDPATGTRARGRTGPWRRTEEARPCEP
jgi:hypothetical protein